MKSARGYLQKWDGDGIHLIDDEYDSEFAFKVLEAAVLEQLKAAATKLLGMYVVCKYDKCNIQLLYQASA